MWNIRDIVSYNIRTTASLLVSARVLRNGTAIPNLTTGGLLSLNFDGSAIVNLTAGDALSLQLFGLLGLATLQNGQGAVLNIQKVD